MGGLCRRPLVAVCTRSRDRYLLMSLPHVHDGSTRARVTYSYAHQHAYLYTPLVHPHTHTYSYAHTQSKQPVRKVRYKGSYPMDTEPDSTDDTWDPHNDHLKARGIFFFLVSSTSTTTTTSATHPGPNHHLHPPPTRFRCGRIHGGSDRH